VVAGAAGRTMEKPDKTPFKSIVLDDNQKCDISICVWSPNCMTLNNFPPFCAMFHFLCRPKNDPLSTDLSMLFPVGVGIHLPAALAGHWNVSTTMV
jgi:hypothetical protein